MDTLGEIIAKSREAKGWTRYELAKRCGYRNHSKWADRIWKIEIDEVPFPDLDLLKRIVRELEIPHELIARAIFKNFLKLNQPIKPYLLFKVAGIYLTQQLPKGLEDLEEIKQYAREIVRERKCTVCIALSRIRGYYIFPSGKETESYFLPTNTFGKVLNNALSVVKMNLPMELFQRKGLEKLDFQTISAIEKSIFG